MIPALSLWIITLTTSWFLFHKGFADPFDFNQERIHFYRDKVKSMFYHAYNGYLEHAYPSDELKPLTCTGQDTWGGYSLTLVDSLDMLLILGNETEFERAAELVIENLDLDRNMNISVFETNIRIIGGLLSAHILSSHAEDMLLSDGWPCSGPLLDLAERFAQRLLPAFNTNTGMPYGTVNLRYGVNNLETPITCVAGIGTFILEFGTLSRLTGNPHYERVALRALESLWESRSKLGLVGNHIDVQTGVYTATDSGIGAGVDSYFEYLVKGSLLFQRPNLMKQFYNLEEAINKHVRKEDWFMWVDKDKATVSLPIFQSLEAFWPGLLTLVGKVEDAARIMGSYAQIIRHVGLAPEFYNLPNREPVHRRAAYPLRPEVPESLMYLYRATKDPAYLHVAASIVDAIDQMTRTKCGFATVRDVTTWTLEDRMESFFLAETAKYLYLIFDEDNFIHNDGSTAKLVETTAGPCMIEAGGWIFNTEAHPLDPGVIYCCSKKREKDRAMLQAFEEEIDLLELSGAQLEGFEEEEKEIQPSASSSFAVEMNELPLTIGDSDEEEEDALQSPPENNQIPSTTDNETPDQTVAAVSKAIKRIFDNAEIKFTIPSERGGQKRDWKALKPILESKFEELKRKILSDASLTEEGDGQEETERTYTVFCEDCCTPADDPALGDTGRAFWHSIYTNYLGFYSADFCWHWEEVEDGQEPSIESQYSNLVPDLDSLDLETQNLDSIDRFSFRRTSSSPGGGGGGWEPEDNFTLLTTPKQPFDRHFLGIGQIVPVR